MCISLYTYRIGLLPISSIAVGVNESPVAETVFKAILEEDSVAGAPLEARVVVVQIGAAQALEAFLIEGGLAFFAARNGGGEQDVLLKGQLVDHVIAIGNAPIRDDVVVVEWDARGVQGFRVGQGADHLGQFPNVANSGRIHRARHRDLGIARLGLALVAHLQGAVHRGGLVAPSQAKGFGVAHVEGEGDCRAAHV